jgi:hypothetical protein
VARGAAIFDRHHEGFEGETRKGFEEGFVWKVVDVQRGTV